MTTGNVEPDRPSQHGERASQPPRQPGARPLDETTIFGIDSAVKKTHAGTPRPTAGDAAKPASSTAGNVSQGKVSQGKVSQDKASQGSGSRLSAVEPPEVVGRFRVGKLLGRGGMASVYLARDVQLDRPVALKIPRMSDDPDGTMIPRFFREARTAATLNHPNICPIYDVGQESDTYFIAMGFIEGRALTDYISSGKRQPDRQVAIVVRKVALALEHAHAHGILHRDLKPANIMIDSRGEPIVMDFGLACRLDDKWETRLTQDGAVIGTPTYMSPEQIDSRAKVGAPADIYSLGVVLYELLTGQCPFTGSLVSVIGQVLHNEPRPVSELRPDVAPALAAICARAMAKKPAERFGSMKEFAQALTSFLKGEAASATALQSLAAPTVSNDLGGLEALLSEAGPATSASDWSAPLSQQRSKGAKKLSPAAMWGIGGGVAALAIVVGLIATLGRGSNPPPDQNAAKQNTPPNGAAAVVQTNAGPSSPAPSSPAPSPAVHEPAPPNPAAGPSPGQTAAGDHVAVQDPSPIAGGASAAADPKDVAANPPAVAETSTDEPSEKPSAKPGDDVAAADQPAAVEDKEGPPRPGLRGKGFRGSRARTQDRGESENSPGGDAGPPADDRPPAAERGGDGPGPGGAGGGRFGPGGAPFSPPEIKSLKELEAYFDQLDRNHDGRLDPGEIPMHIILRADKNRDRALSYAELKQAFQKMGIKLFAEPSASELKQLPRPGGPPGGGFGGPNNRGGPGGGPPGGGPGIGGPPPPR